MALAFLWIGVCGAIFFPLIGGSGVFTTPWDAYVGRAIHSQFWLNASLLALLVFWYLAYLTYAAIGFGLWRLKNWARIALFTINIIGAGAGLLAALFFVRPGLLALAAAAGTIPTFLWMAWYSQRPRVRFAFGARQNEAPVLEPPPGLSQRGRIAVVCGLIATLVLYAGCLWAAVESMLQASEVFQAALKQAQVAPCVVNALGVPLTPGWTTTGGMEESADGGNAELSIPVRGPKGNGRINFEAEKHNGIWKFNTLILVRGPEQTRIELQDSTAVCK